MELARANVAANVGAAAGLRVEPLAWGAPLPAARARHRSSPTWKISSTAWRSRRPRPSPRSGAAPG